VYEQKTSNPAAYAKLGVEDTTGQERHEPAYRAGRRAEAGELIVGKQGVGARSNYVRRAGEPQAG
jgi:hypothetical protein